MGNWINEEKNLIVNCYKQNNKYYGKVIWYKAYIKNSAIDGNGEPTAKSMHAIIMKDFVFDTDEWKEGYITDLDTGDNYKAYLARKNTNELVITGYVLFRIFSETSNFIRYTNSALPNGDPVPLK